MAYRDGWQQLARSRRSWHLAALVGIGALVLAVRLFQLQVLGVREYTLQSQRNRIRIEKVTAPRGLIEDRDGRILADSRPSYTVRAIPRRLLGDPTHLRLLARMLDMPEEDIVSRLRNGSANYPAVVCRDASFVQVSRVAENEEDLPGVSLDVATVRWYPNGRIGAHVLGHVGEISPREVESLAAAGYESGDFIGRMGLERTYETDLRGVDGERWLEVDAVGRVVGRFAPEQSVVPKPGKALHLHLDLGLQTVADSCLIGRRGAVAMLDVRTGGVLVLASAPGFDPNLFAAGIRGADWRSLNNDPERPLLFRAVQATYAPGSTFKMVTFVAALDEHVVGYTQRFPAACYGGYRFGNRYYRCWDPKGHGALASEDALVRSCDTYFYQVGERVPADALAHRARDAGLGVKTGIDLPQELSGLVPDSEWLNRRWGVKGWTQGTVLNHAIGQGEYLVTPLQMARYAAMFALSGELLEPHLVESIEQPDGTRTPVPRKVVGTWSVPPETMARVREAMHQVVLRGTGAVCKIPEYMPAGKTGTAENPHGQAHSWFMGFAPFENPEVAFAVIVEAGGHGSDVAAPIAKRLLQVIVARRTPPEATT